MPDTMRVSGQYKERCVQGPCETADYDLVLIAKHNSHAELLREDFVNPYHHLYKQREPPWMNLHTRPLRDLARGFDIVQTEDASLVRPWDSLAYDCTRVAVEGYLSESTCEHTLGPQKSPPLEQLKHATDLLDCKHLDRRTETRKNHVPVSLNTEASHVIDIAVVG